jgi:hypothetical protein
MSLETDGPFVANRGQPDISATQTRVRCKVEERPIEAAQLVDSMSRTQPIDHLPLRTRS